MFAIALWDAREQTLWLVRDRIGIKPLYYAFRDGRLVFASEIKALLADPRQPRAVDEEALFHYLSFLSTPAPQHPLRRHPEACRRNVAPGQPGRPGSRASAGGTSGITQTR